MFVRKRVILWLALALLLLAGCKGQAVSSDVETIPAEWAALCSAEKPDAKAMGAWLEEHGQDLSATVKEKIITDYGRGLILSSTDVSEVYYGLLPYENDASPAVQEFMKLLKLETEEPMLEENFSQETIEARLARASMVEKMIGEGDGAYLLSLRQFFSVYMEGALGGMGTIYHYADLEGKVFPLVLDAWKTAEETYAETAVGQVISTHLQALQATDGQVNHETFQQYLTNLRVYVQTVAESIIPLEESDV